ncbi:MAG: cytochrome c oxidase subunit 3 family protein [Bacteroidia bacterium]|nr:cytochrome c oxidase subunit 3 family protein [Bacteroidia bacterium]
MENKISHTEHRDDTASKMGMWLFIFTELLLFGGLFIVYAVYRSKYSEDFHVAANQLNTFVGTINTIILLVSSMTVAMSVTALRTGNKSLTLKLLATTIFFAFLFLVNKYFEWGLKIDHHLYPGSELMLTLKRGELLFFGLYYFMTGLHALHIIVGMILLIVIYRKVQNGRLTKDDNALLENGGLYWHLVDLIWIFLFPLLYLIS